LYHRVEPEAISQLIANCELRQPDDAFCFSHGVLKWKAQLAHTQKDNVAEAEQGWSLHRSNLAGWLAHQPRHVKAACWWLSLYEDQEGSTMRADFRAAFQAHNADPTFMALELLQAGRAYPMPDPTRAAKQNGQLCHHVVVTTGVCEQRHYMPRLNRLMRELLEQDVSTLNKADVASRLIYAV
jgi:hypothetical protein